MGCCRSQISIKKTFAPIRCIFGWKKTANEQASFGPETATPRKSNTRNKNDPFIGKQITIKGTENDPNTANTRPTKLKDVSSELERRRIRWKKGLELTSNIPVHSKFDDKLLEDDSKNTMKGGIRCIVRYEGIPRHVKFPVGDGTWPSGWCQREIVWMSHGKRKCCDFVWFTPLRKKALHSIGQVNQFVFLLHLYDGNEDKAYDHVMSLNDDTSLPRTIH